MRRAAIVAVLAAGLLATAFAGRGCFWAAMMVEGVRADLADAAKIRDIARYEEVRGRAARRVPAEEVDAFPARVPASATGVRMLAQLSGEATSLVLHAVLPPGEARAVAADARARSAYVVRGWAPDPHESCKDETGRRLMWGWTRPAAEEFLGVPLPADVRMFVLKDTQHGGGLGASFSGARVMVLVNEEEGVVVWTLLHHHDSPPPDG